LESLSIQEIVDAVDGTLLQGRSDLVVTGVSTDTRSLASGDLFFALAGENSDGHRYVKTAIDAGASAVVLSDESAVPPGASVAVVKVPDVLYAFGDLAKFYRSRFNVRVVGITGSVGKTMTKEMLASILERKWNVLKNVMNYNNEIGVPQTLFQLDRSHEVVVLEMAMRGIGEIRRLASISQPSVGVITNIGLSHIERLGSQGAIADAKSELLSELPDDGVAVLNGEDGYFEVLQSRVGCKLVSFGSCKSANVVGARIKQTELGRYSFVVMVEGGAIEVKLPVLGQHNVYNALAAAAAANAMGVDLYTIRDGLQNFSQPAMRMELVKCKAGYVILNDAYNASPASMGAALKTLNSLAGYDRKIAILGDMLELGDYAPKAHHDVGNSVAASGVSMLVTVGDIARNIAEGAGAAGFPESSIQSYANSLEAGAAVKELLAPGDAVLIKGSRGMKMEEIARILLSD
jgi:UDP-N-acetylmuramoyl-tripeptide--D-alanyl-D-alanine ligase